MANFHTCFKVQLKSLVEFHVFIFPHNLIWLQWYQCDTKSILFMCVCVASKTNSGDSKRDEGRMLQCKERPIYCSIKGFYERWTVFLHFIYMLYM